MLLQNKTIVPILTTDQQINARLYRLPQRLEEEVRNQINNMERQGNIRKSNSRYASPIVVVAKKPDSERKTKFRVCVDYRALNDITVAKYREYSG